MNSKIKNFLIVLALSNLFGIVGPLFIYGFLGFPVCVIYSALFVYMINNKTTYPKAVGISLLSAVVASTVCALFLPIVLVGIVLQSVGIILGLFLIPMIYVNILSKSA